MSAALDGAATRTIGLTAFDRELACVVVTFMCAATTLRELRRTNRPYRRRLRPTPQSGGRWTNLYKETLRRTAKRDVAVTPYRVVPSTNQPNSVQLRDAYASLAALQDSPSLPLRLVVAPSRKLNPPPQGAGK